MRSGFSARVRRGWQASSRGTSTFDAVNQRYVITLAGETYDLNKYVTTVTPINVSTPRFVATQSSSGKLLVKIFNLSGAAVQNAFGFVVFSP